MTKSPGAWKHFVAAFAIALVGYVVCFQWIEHRRVRKGPWRVEFRSQAGQLGLVVRQSALGIEGITIQMADVPVVTNLAQSMEFKLGQSVPFDIPFGRCVFLDPLFLPGKVVLEIAGHEIQLMPRVLMLNGKEHPWQSAREFTLPESGGVPAQK